MSDCSCEIRDAGTRREVRIRDTSCPQHRKRVRRTVDLTLPDHAALNTWCAETATELEAARVTSQDVMTTLITRLLTDETLARKIRADIRRSASKP